MNEFGFGVTPEISSVAAGVVLAGGSGSRVGADRNKVYLSLRGRPVLSWSLTAFHQVRDLKILVVVIRPEDRKLIHEVLAVLDLPVEIVLGGTTRQESELCALRHLADRIDAGVIDTVLLHDGARPLVRPELIAEVLRTAREHGAAVPGLPAEDVFMVNENGNLTREQPTEDMSEVQTPQGFQAASLLAAYEEADVVGFHGTDTASCIEKFSTLSVREVPGDQENFKVTYLADLHIAEQVLGARMK